MKNKIFTILAVISLSFFILAGLPSRNANGGLVADELIAEGIELYKAGDESKAMHQFSKALIIDPDNKTVKEYLQKMGMERGLYAPEQSGQAMPMKEMAQEVHSYKDKLNNLEKEKFEKEKLAQALAEDKKDLKRAINVREVEMADLRQELGQMQEEWFQQAELEASRQADANQAAQKNLRRDNDLYELKNRITRQLALIDQKNQQIKKLQKQVNASQKQTKKASLGYEKKLVDMQHDYNQYRSKTWRKEVTADQKFELLRSYLRKSKADIDELNDSLLLTNRKVASLENKLLVRTKALDELRLSRSRDCPPAVIVKAGTKQKEQGCPDAKLLIQQAQRIVEFKAKLAQAQAEIAALRKNIKEGGQKDVGA